MNSDENRNLDKLLTEYVNWLVIVAMLVLNVAISLMTVKEGSIALKDYSNYTWLDWVGFAVTSTIPAVLALVVDMSFSKEGIRKGKLIISNWVEEYEKRFKVSEGVILRSERQYLKENAKRKTVKKFITVLILSIFTQQLILGINQENIIRLIINVSAWLILGFVAYRNSYEYATTELKHWYINEIQQLKRKEDSKCEDIYVSIADSPVDTLMR